MSQSQNHSLDLKQKKHRRRNKVYTVPIVEICIKSMILRNPHDHCLNNEETPNPENTIKSTLCKTHAIFIVVFPDRNYYLKRNFPDTMVLLLSSRVVTAKDINRFIENTMISDDTPMINILSISATISSNMIMNLQPESLEAMSNTMHKLFDEFREQTIIAKPYGVGVEKPKNTTKIDTTAIPGLKNFECTQNKPIKFSKMIKSGNTSNVRIPENRSLIACKCFKTYFVESRHKRYKTSSCKFNSFSIEVLKKLVELLYSSGIVLNKPKSNGISVYRRNWHVRSVTQGYLLTILLKQFDIAALNVMRKPYFVIIEFETCPITSVKFNFKLSNGLAMAFNPRVLEKCTLDFTQWNEEHKRILNKSISFSFRVCKPRDKEDVLTDADTIECKINASYYEFSTTLKNDPDDRDKNTNFYSESELFDIKSRGGSETRVTGSIFSLPINDIPRQKSVFNPRKVSGNMNVCPRKPRKQTNMHDIIVKLTKACFLKLFNKSQAIKAFLGIPNMNCDRLINETIFEGLQINEFIKSMTHCWPQVKVQTYCSVLYLFSSTCTTCF